MHAWTSLKSWFQQTGFINIFSGIYESIDALYFTGYVSDIETDFDLKSPYVDEKYMLKFTFFNSEG